MKNIWIVCITMLAWYLLFNLSAVSANEDATLKIAIEGALPGEYHFTLQADGYQPLEKTLSLPQESQVTLSLIPTIMLNNGQITLTVITNPADARVRIMNIRDKYHDGIALVPGEYEIEVSREGYETYKHWLTLHKPTEHAVTLKKTFAKTINVKLTIVANPSGAQVRILNIQPKYRDGIALEPGYYEIEVTKQGYQKYQQWLAITGNLIETINLLPLGVQPKKIHIIGVLGSQYNSLNTGWLGRYFSQDIVLFSKKLHEIIIEENIQNLQLSVLYFDAISQDLRLKDMSLTFTSKETTYDSIYNIINNYTFFIRDVENSSAIKLTEQLQFISNSLQENNQNTQIIIFADSPQAEDFRKADFLLNSVIILGNTFAPLGDNYITLGKGDWVSNTVEKLKNNLR